MQKNNVDIYELNHQMLMDASKLSAINPKETMEKYGVDEETCARLSKLTDAEIAHISKTNMSLFLASIGFNELERV